MNHVYSASSLSFEGAVRQLLEQFMRENPSIGGYQFTYHDDIKVSLKLDVKPPKTAKRKAGSK